MLATENNILQYCQLSYLKDHPIAAFLTQIHTLESARTLCLTS
jgi:hypothetical protein